MQNTEAATTAQNGQYNGPLPAGKGLPPIIEVLPSQDTTEANTPKEESGGHVQNDEREKIVPIGLPPLKPKSNSGDSIAQKFLRSALTARAMVTLDVPEKLPIIVDWFKHGDIGYIFATRGVGKTWFSMEMAKAISTGKNFGPWEVKEAQRVLYIDGEVGLGDTKKRNKALEIANDNFIYLHHEHLYQRTHLTMDVADAEQQEAFLAVCLELEVKVVFLDNLSCLAPGVDENDSFGFSNELLNFTLNMRRNGISLVFVQHAGRNGQMRGHSRREDPANWIIRLDESRDADDVAGAKFLSVFVKNRNAQRIPTTYEWHFLPDGDKTLATFKEMDPLSLFRTLIQSGVVQNKEIAEAMGLKPYEVSRLATKATKQGWLTKRGQSYAFTGKDADPEEKKDFSWIHEGDTRCTVTDGDNETRVTCSASGEEINGKPPGEKKHPMATVARGLTMLNKECSCGGKHYIEKEE
jgi:hypothetical protein